MTLNNGAKFLQVMVKVSDFSGEEFSITSTLAIRTLIRAKILEGRHPRYGHQSNDGSYLGCVASQGPF